MVVRSAASATARSASALARCRRPGWCGVAPSAEKKTKCSTPALSAARSSRQVAMPASSSIVACGWSRWEAARWTTTRAPRMAWRKRAGIGQVADRDLDPHALGAEAARVADEAADRLAARREAPQQRGADEPGGAGEEQHASL